jgi:hypothetical protein
MMKNFKELVDEITIGILGLFDSFLVLNLPQGANLSHPGKHLRRQTWHNKCMILGLAYTTKARILCLNSL